MSSERILTLLKDLEEASRMKSPTLQESFNNVAKELLSNTYTYKNVTFNISEIEFGCTGLGDRIKGADAQCKTGLVYVHKTVKNEKFPGLKHLGMDITCGSFKNFASILIRGITIGRKDIKGPSESLSAILAHEEEGFEITKELSEKLKLIDEKPFFDLFKVSKIVNPKEIKIGKRKSIKGDKDSDLLLRATCLAHPDGRKELIGIG